MPFAAKISEGFVIIAKNSLDNEIERNDNETRVDKFRYPCYNIITNSFGRFFYGIHDLYGSA